MAQPDDDGPDRDHEQRKEAVVFGIPAESGQSSPQKESDPPSARVQNLAGHLNNLSQETAIFHLHQLSGLQSGRQNHPHSGLQIPGLGCNHQIVPVGHQRIGGHPQRLHSVLELLNEVLLVTAPVVFPNHRRRSQLGRWNIRDIKVIASLRQKRPSSEQPLEICSPKSVVSEPADPRICRQTLGQMTKSFS